MASSRARSAGLFAACLVWLAGATASGFIDPKRTPQHLCQQAELIVVAVPRATGAATRWTLAVRDVLKGRAGDAPALDLAPCTKGRPAQFARLLADNGDEPAVLFAATQNRQTRALLHVAGRWLALAADPRGGWRLEGRADRLSGFYDGGTDALIRMTRHLVRDPTAAVPTSVGTVWAARARLGKVAGRVTGMAAVEVGGRGIHLFVASTGGDRLFRPRDDQDAMADVTAAAGLATRSRRFAWADVDRDGLADLVSWDGAALSVRRARRDGTFAASRPDPLARLGGECLGLAPLRIPTDGSPGILVSTGGGPFVVAPDGRRRALPVAGARAGAGVPSACIVADLDGDGFADVLQPRGAGALLWRGGPRGFGPPAPCRVRAPGGGARAAIGDFDGDGSLDLFLSARQANELWENDGKGGFEPVIARAGSLRSKAPAGALDCVATDLNHDGRADLALCYADSAFRYHFNRGFRCFGEQGDLRLAAGSGFRGGPIDVGAQACAVGDLNADAGLDLAAAFTNGELYAYYNHLCDAPTLALRLPKGATGPVTVSVWQGLEAPFCVGTVAVGGHSPPALVALRRPGACTLRYRLPGRSAVERRLTVGKRFADVVLGE